jgi:hypothetical protein
MSTTFSQPRAAGRFPSRWACIAGVGLTLLAASAPVLAGTSNLTVDVHSALTPPPLPDVVSPSASTCTFPTLVKGCTTAAYAVKIGNGTTSNVSNAWFHATTYVVDGADALTPYKAEFLTAPGCSISADSTTIACNIGNLPAGSSPSTFVVTVHSPSVTASGHKIKLVWDIPSGQGASGSLSPVSSSTALTQTSFTTIGNPPTAKKSTTRSWVTVATELYTGDTDIATAANLATVKVKLPQAPEVSDTSCTTADFPKCATYTLDIPGEFDDGTIGSYLTIVLQRDVSTIKPGAKVENVMLYHRETAGSTRLLIQNCDSLTGLIPAYAPAGTDPNLCIALREVYPNNAGKDLKGDFKITIRGRRNGVMEW